ncbi:MAG: EAL domain-containing protein, partial [Clostridia bacterium]
MKKKISLKSAYLFPLMIIIMFLLLFIMLFQMRFSITQFVMEQAATDNEMITKEKSSLFSSLLDNMELEAKGILHYTEFSFINIDNEYDARESINDYFYKTNCVKFMYFMRDGRMYDQDARIYLSIDDNLKNLKESKTVALSKPFYDSSSKTELIIIYVPNEDFNSEVSGIAAYYKVSNIYAIGEFYVSDVGSYYIVDENGTSVFEKDKGVTVKSLLENFVFPTEDINNILKFMQSEGNIDTIISSFDSAVVSVSSIQNLVDWYVISLLPSTVISDKTSNVIEQTMLISAIIMGVFIVFVFVFLAADSTALRKMERLQNIDPIAECANQYKFEVDANELIKSNKTTQYAIIYINILNFKNIKQLLPVNDVNTMIRNLSNILKKSMVKNLETYGRTSDGRMIALIMYKQIHDIEEKFYEITEKLKEIGPVSGYMIRINAGVYCIDRDARYLVSEMIDRASFAQNSIREDANTSLEFYHQKSHDDLLRTIALEGFMEKALDNEEFVIYFQPKYDLVNNSIYGAEALVRWIRPNEGIVPPSQFINLFERSGYISQLDKFVFTEVCKFHNKMKKQGSRIIPISVNVSRASAEKDDFIEYYVNTKNIYQIKDGFLELEFTESKALEDYEILSNRIKELKKYGFVCSIDDFGAGYSSFKALQALDFDILKLDAAFLKTDTSNTNKNINLLSGVISLGKTLGMKVIA